MSEKKKKVAVGISGGVDSAVAAYLLIKAGYEVTGVHMKCWENGMVGCTADDDKKSAVQTAAFLGIKLEILDYVEKYKEKVLSYFYEEYSKGRTPNPDVMCNREIKFGLFFDWALSRGFDFVATGHYARVSEGNVGVDLLKGVDPAKDQSYFLYTLGQKQLERTLFPLGSYLKSEVRDLAKKIGLPPAVRPDSVGICFIGEVDIKKFLMEKIAPKKGVVVDTDGTVVGEHDGVWFYTIGQRHGFRLTKYFGTPMYVVGKNVEKNELVVGTDSDALKNSFEVAEVTWTNVSKVSDFTCEVRIRHLGEMHKARLKRLTDGLWGVSLEKSVFGVAPGQSVVFYEGDVVLGGGVIV